jgi:hypothetical protein
MTFIPHEGQDYKEDAADESALLSGFWREYVSQDRGPSVEDGYSCPRAFLWGGKREKNWDTVRHRFFRYLASLSTSEFRQFAFDAQKRYEWRLARHEAYFEEEFGDCDSDDESLGGLDSEEEESTELDQEGA